MNIQIFGTKKCNDAKTAEHTGMNCGAENDKLKNRARRINLEEA